VRRREALAGLAGLSALATWPRAASAQRAGRAPLIGALLSGLESDPDSQVRIAAFRQGLAAVGWMPEQNIRIEYRWSGGRGDRIQQYAAELVALRPDVILANSTPVITAFKALTSSIPVVFALAIDPVGLGHVQSLSHPGGNFTGFTFIDSELIAKWMGLLKDVMPVITRAALLHNPTTVPVYRKFVQELDAARQPGWIELAAMPVQTTAEMESAIDALAQKPGGSLMIGPDPFNIVRLNEIAQLAARNRLPAISVYRPFAVEGGLMAYGPDTADIFRRSAGYVDRILKGATPADLPVQQPTKFDLVINLKTATALGLTVPPTLLAQADEVIE
jgi:putative ABC transport system substrate-binding protein